MEVVEALKLVARNRAVDAAQQQVELAVAIDVRELRDVLAVSVDRLTRDVAQRVRRDHKPRRGVRAHVAVVADVAERRFRKQVDQSIAVEIDEPIPLTDVEILKALRRQLPAACRSLVQLQIVRILLDE